MHQTPIQPTKIIKTRRRTLALEINSGAELIIRAPLHVTDNQINHFLSQKAAWIQKHTKRVKDRMEKSQSSASYLQIKNITAAKLNNKLKTELLPLITQKVASHALTMDLKYKSVKLSKAKTKWGSCSAKNNLLFSWTLGYAPKTVLDYVIIHELAHIPHKNHSKKFWELVQRFCPDYKNQRKWLREHAVLLETAKPL